MKGRAALLAVMVVVVVFGVERALRPTTPTDGSRLSKPRTVDVNEVVEYVDMQAHTYRLRTMQDVLPGGLSAAMAPALVNWQLSDLNEGGSVLLRNVNAGGNPLSGVTVLRSVRVYPDKIERVEFVLVPLGGPEAIAHGQLRFVFEEGGAAFIGETTETVGEPLVLQDLVLSWEAWRPPGVDYDVLSGMDPTNYELTMRAYAGTQRFLEDALQRRDWNAHTMQLPGGKQGHAELLLVALALGDGSARQSIGAMLEEAEEQWLTAGPAAEAGRGSRSQEAADALSQWRALREMALEDGVPAQDARLDMRGRTSYQTLVASCATMALYAVDVSVARLIERGVPANGMRPTRDPEMEEQPEWMTGLAHANMAGIFALAPRTIRFALARPSAIPGRIPGALESANLLMQENGKPRKRHYSMSGETPWGRPEHLLLR